MRPIDADTLEKWLETNKANANPLDYNTKATYAECITKVKNMETIESEPVRHGQWENYPGHTYRRCSLCKMEWAKPQFNIRANYCPNCGARMDLGEKHG